VLVSTDSGPPQAATAASKSIPRRFMVFSPRLAGPAKVRALPHASDLAASGIRPLRILVPMCRPVHFAAQARQRAVEAVASR
jgi:hypothetical protein